MMMDLDKLTEEERVQIFGSEKWIGYPKANDILGKMQDLLNQPKTHRMKNLLVVGESNNGKTAIIKRFEELNPITEDDYGDTIWPVLYAECPPSPDEKRLYIEILDAIGILFKPSSHVDVLRTMLLKSMARLNIRMLILDEIHNILAGHPTRQRQMLNTIKMLGNKLKIPVVAAGTKDSFSAIQSESQLANRFMPAVLTPWKINSDFQKLLASFEKLLPLKKQSGLASKEMTIKIHTMTGGVIGEVSNLLVEATAAAIRSGKECIDLEILSNLDWYSPDERNLAASGL